MLVAGISFENSVPVGTMTGNKTSATIEQSYGAHQTRLLLIEDDGLAVCIVSSDFPNNALPISDVIRDKLATILKIPRSHVLNCTTHNHCTTLLSHDTFEPYLIDRWAEYRKNPTCRLTSVGRSFMRELCAAARSIRRRLQPVTVWWSVGHEKRISYNRKGRRADSTTYFMRENDRCRIARDYSGDIDTQAPVVVFRGENGMAVAALAQFTAHPVTAYHPEHPVAHGEYPQVATRILAKHLAGKYAVPAVAFLQGCCGDVNSKKMFVGGAEAADRYGRYLGATYVRAARRLQQSRRNDLSFRVETASVPLARLPSIRTLDWEIAEMQDFVQRALAGDEETLSCVGLNFPSDLSPLYRARLVEAPLAWCRWAREQQQKMAGTRSVPATLPNSLDLELSVIRLGDVGIVCMPCEPFQGIGRQIRAKSPLPLTIPVGYTQVSHGYITDGANTGDREYMSSFYRYTRFRAPLKRPAGDVLARVGVRVLREMN